MTTSSTAPGRSKRLPRAVSAGSKPATTLSTLDDALAALNARVNVERVRPSHLSPDVFKLDRMRALVERLDHPDRVTRFVHVAGSKGKGSVVEMLAASLTACGYAVGIFTSPHLIDVRERIRIADRWIDEADFIRLIDRVVRAASSLPRKLGETTFFEIITATAMCYFAEQAVDLAVIEVGLGGRLDATNIITPEVCAITAIQLEHTAILGETLEEIAREKAGIFKPGVGAITIQQPPEVIEAIRQCARSVGAPLAVLGEDMDFSYRFESSPELGPHVRVCLSTIHSNYEHLAVPLRGHHQAANCGLVLGILDRLCERGFDAPETLVAKGLAATACNGRLEQVWDSPRIVIDGAHTPESIEALMKAIGAHIRYDSMVVIFACAADKNTRVMLQRLAIGADKVIFTRLEDSLRSADPHDLQKLYAEISPKMTQVVEVLKDAINMAHRAVGRDDLICVTGSFYVAGAAKALFQKARRRSTKA